MTAKNVVKSYLDDNLSDSAVSIDKHNSSKLGVYRDHLNIHYN